MACSHSSLLLNSLCHTAAWQVSSYRWVRSLSVSMLGCVARLCTVTRPQPAQPAALLCSSRESWVMCFSVLSLY